MPTESLANVRRSLVSIVYGVYIYAAVPPTESRECVLACVCVIDMPVSIPAVCCVCVVCVCYSMCVVSVLCVYMYVCERVYVLSVCVCVCCVCVCHSAGIVIVDITWGHLLCRHHLHFHQLTSLPSRGQERGHLLAGQHIRFHCDNLPIVQAWTNQSSRPGVMDLLRTLFFSYPGTPPRQTELYCGRTFPQSNVTLLFPLPPRPTS